ncbi:hypothetical protein Tco_0295508 [Tanacetum coccineum]
MADSDTNNEPWYADYVNYLASRVLPFRSTRQEKQKFFSDLRHYFWDEPFLFKQCADRIIRRCVARYEAAQILQQCHSIPSRGHHGIATTARKDFEVGYETKGWHDKRIKAPTNYKRGDKVLLFNSRLRLFLEKLKSRWYGPFSVSKDMKNNAIELYDEDENEFIINKQRVKPYQKNVLDTNRDDDITLDDEGEVIFDEKKLGSS